MEKIEVADQFSIPFLDFTNPYKKQLVGFSIDHSLQGSAIDETIFLQNVVSILDHSMGTVLVTFVVVVDAAAAVI